MVTTLSDLANALEHYLLSGGTKTFKAKIGGKIYSSIQLKVKDGKVLLLDLREPMPSV